MEVRLLFQNLELTNSCMEHKVKGAQELEALKKKQEAEERRKEHEEYLKNRSTVESVLKHKKKQAVIALLTGILVIVAVCVLL